MKRQWLIVSHQKLCLRPLPYEISNDYKLSQKYFASYFAPLRLGGKSGKIPPSRQFAKKTVWHFNRLNYF
jgi:hypothetical protein